MTDYFPAPASSVSVIASSRDPNQADTMDDCSRELALTIAQAADDRKGADIIVLKVAGVSYLTDYFVIITGFSKAQVRAIASSIADKTEEQWQRKPVHTEGQAGGAWVLQDYGDVIVHILMPQERAFYNLEAFWGHAEQIDFSAVN